MKGFRINKYSVRILEREGTEYIPTTPKSFPDPVLETLLFSSPNPKKLSQYL